MTMGLTCLLVLALVALFSVPVLADDQNATPSTTVVTTAATTVPPAPVASFTGSPASGTAPLTVQFTDTSTGSPFSWSWDFGDGGSSTSENPSYTYSSEGTYTVSLVVMNTAGSDTSTAADYITVSPAPSAPEASFTATPVSGIAPLTVGFTDASTGSPTEWSWDFGDGGSSTDQDPEYTYTVAGNYTVSLTATNEEGSDTATEEDYISVFSAPVASFTGSPSSGTAPLTVQFTDTSTGSPSSWRWDFGDGGSSTDQDPVYTYSYPGTYSVTLTAMNDEGSNTSTGEDYVTVATQAPFTPAAIATPVQEIPPSAPVASFIDDPILGSAPLTVQFTDLSEGSPTSWSWDFGDGGSSTDRNPSHIYSAPGSYSAILTVANEIGTNISTGGVITVLSPGASQSPLSPLVAGAAVGIAIFVTSGMHRRKGR